MSALPTLAASPEASSSFLLVSSARALPFENTTAGWPAVLQQIERSNPKTTNTFFMGGNHSVARNTEFPCDCKKGKNTSGFGAQNGLFIVELRFTNYDGQNWCQPLGKSSIAIRKSKIESYLC